MQIVLVRHAHRDTSDRSLDNGLSEKGKEQAALLVADFKRARLLRANTIWTSPKKRCLETIAPLAREMNAEVRIDPLLDEQGELEASRDFSNRMRKLVSKIEAFTESAYLCSHGDVLPELLRTLAGKQYEMKKGEAIALENIAGNWKIL